MALLVAAAERARSGAHGALETPFGLWLGEISYALYMVHLGVGMVFFEAAQRLFGEQPAFSVPHIALGILGVGAAIVTAALAERYVERPGRALIQSIRLRRVEA
jgi:peptidoglycan/LPS O-acetylase OafA/YrhL